MRRLLCLLASINCACVGDPVMPAHAAKPDQVLLFEQRRAASGATPAWESWSLYDSGRYVYASAGADPNKQRITVRKLETVHAWLRQHDFELTRAAPSTAALGSSGVSASCQIRLSSGLVLAGAGDRRFYACDALKQLLDSE